MVLLEDFIREACPDLADRLVAFRFRVVARQKEGTVDIGALALAVVGADDDEVERVTDVVEVVLFELRGGVKCECQRSAK